jgi:hypothetical protein
MIEMLMLLLVLGRRTIVGNALLTFRRRGRWCGRALLLLPSICCLKRHAHVPLESKIMKLIELNIYCIVGSV